ncbi:MAG: 4'-phosphopantetheinyl transferase superfamily protein [Parasporobacterium sp.]|nr:4'-phosphopantetheinyl transferase superfamily protein [Parasporobacterium sp.]
MIRTYLINKEELADIQYKEELFSPQRRQKIESSKRQEDKDLSACAELLLIYGLSRAGRVELPLNIEENERKKLQLPGSSWHFNLSHAKDYAVCTVADAPVGVDIESFRVRELMSPERMLHPEEARLLAYISNSNEKKKYFYECWVAKESYLKNLGIGLIVRPRDFLVREERLVIRDEEYQARKGHHARSAVQVQEPAGSGDTTLSDNLSYLEPRYVHVFEPGEIRGTDWKFDAGYRVAVCSMDKDPDHTARLIHAADINQALEEIGRKA